MTFSTSEFGESQFHENHENNEPPATHTDADFSETQTTTDISTTDIPTDATDAPVDPAAAEAAPATSDQRPRAAALLVAALALVKGWAITAWAAVRRFTAAGAARVWTPRTRKPIMIGAASVVTLAVIIAGSVVALTKTVTISVDGATQEVSTMSGTVEGALDAAGIEIGEHDTLAPGPESSLSDGSRIVIERGRLFTAIVDGSEKSVWTTATTVSDAMADLGIEASDFQLSASADGLVPVEGATVIADTLHTVTLTYLPAPTEVQPQNASAALKADGTSLASTAVHRPERITTAAKTVAQLLKEEDVTLGEAQRIAPGLGTQLRDGLNITITTLPTVTLKVGTDDEIEVIAEAETVGDFLAEQDIALGKFDTVSPKVDDTVIEGLDVTVNRVEFKTTTKKVEVPQPADKKVNDDTLDKGKTKIVTKGHPGQVEITYKTKVVNGKAGKAEEVSRTTVTEAVATEIRVGTYVKPKKKDKSTPPKSGEQPRSGEQSRSGAQPDTSGGPGVGVWNQIAQCESGQRWNINTGNGYYGGLQFDIPTWLGNGGGKYAPRADLATKAQQIDIANQVYKHRGLQPWSCARIIGLI